MGGFSDIQKPVSPEGTAQRDEGAIPSQPEMPHSADDRDAAFSAFKVQKTADGNEVLLCRERD